MTSSYEAVMSLAGIFLKCVYRVGTKTHKVSTCSESCLGVILKIWNRLNRVKSDIDRVENVQNDPEFYEN